MLRYLVYIIAAGFIYESISWVFRLHTAFFWIKKERLKRHVSPKNQQKLFLLIPVLAEMEILPDTANYFNTNFIKDREDTFLVFITTEKENLTVGGGRNTIHIAEEVVKDNPRFIHIHYPHTSGKMANQLNYAIRVLIESNNIGDKDLIAIYNADSRPERETMDWVRLRFNQGDAKAFQQYGCYTGNILQMRKLPSGSILIAASVWQTRWAIGFEIYNALKQFRIVNRKGIFKLNYPFNYCIGHGLFITKGVFERVGGFSEDMHNEDAIFGLQLSDMQELLMPIPYFDISESPDSLDMLYKQQSNWFFGPLQAYSYTAGILERHRYNFFRKIRLFILSSKLFFHSVFWIVGPSLALIEIVIAVILRDPGLFLVAVVSIFLFGLPSIITYIFIRRLRIPSVLIGSYVVAGILGRGFFLSYVIHGASAYRGLIRYIKQLISGNAPTKEKTLINRISL